MIKTSKAIQAAFDAAVDRIDWDGPHPTAIWDLIDIFVDTGSFISHEAIAAALCVGQANPGKPIYSLWWDETVCYFVGEEQSIIDKLNEFKG